MNARITNIPLRILSLLAGILLLTASVARAQGPSWISIGGPDGGAIGSLAYAHGALVAGTSSSGIFRSSDNGASWSQITDGISPTLAINQLASSGDTIYAAAADGVYRSLDAGLRWSRLETVPYTWMWYVSALNGVILAADNDGVYRISVEGKVEIAAQPASDGTTVGPLAIGAEALWASGSGGAYRSTDGGMEWKKITLDTFLQPTFGGIVLSGTTVVAAVPGLRAIMRSTDNGEHWDSTRTGVIANALTAAGDTIYASLYDGSLLRSTDFGATWAIVPTAAKYLGQLLISPAGIFSRHSPGVIRSADNCITWTPTVKGLKAQTPTMLLRSGNALLMSGITGPYRLLRDGIEWESTAAPEMNTLHADAIHKHGDYIFLGTGNGIFRSSDNGAHWTEKSGNISTKWADGFTSANGAIFLVQGGWLFRSTNDGEQWSHVGAELNAVALDGLASIDGTLLAYGANGVYRSTNQGASWTRSMSGLESGWIYRVVAAGSGFYALTRDGIFRSTDDGRTWSELSRDVRGVQARYLAARGAELYLGSNNGVLRSADDGRTWSPLNTGLRDTRIQWLMVDEGTLYAATAGNGVFKLQLPAMAVPGQEDRSARRGMWLD